MKKEFRYCRRGQVTWAAKVLALMLMAAGAQALEVKPGQIEFTKIEESATLTLTHNGAPVPTSSIQSVKLYVGNYDYDHMIAFSKSDGKVTVRPTEMLELGMYNLVIKTGQGDATVAVRALQRIVDESLEAQAARQGVSVADVKAQLGISQPLGLERINLGLPELYYKGQTLAIAMDLAPGREAIWRVNGVVVPAPDGRLAYTLEQVGVYDVAYLEKEGERTVALGLDSVTVAPEPPVQLKAETGTTVQLMAPEGFGIYAWTRDGAAVEGDLLWSGAFEQPGIYQVVVRASSPGNETLPAFREVIFSITVS